MEQVVNFIESLKAVDIIDIIVAICLIILFKVLSPSISYMIIKIFKFNSRECILYSFKNIFHNTRCLYCSSILKETS